MFDFLHVMASRTGITVSAWFMRFLRFFRVEDHNNIDIIETPLGNHT